MPTKKLQGSKYWWCSFAVINEFVKCDFCMRPKKLLLCFEQERGDELLDVHVCLECVEKFIDELKACENET